MQLRARSDNKMELALPQTETCATLNSNERCSKLKFAAPQTRIDATSNSKLHATEMIFSHCLSIVSDIANLVISLANSLK